MIKIVDTYSGNKFNPGQLKMDGITGIIFKAGQGGIADVPRVHPDWWKMAADFGLLRGWYWLVDSRIHSSNHIRAMDIAHIFDDTGELGVWADVEKPVIRWSEAEYLATPYAGHDNVRDFVYLLDTMLDKKPGIYSGPGAYELVMRRAPQITHNYLAQFDLWTAQYNNYIDQPDLYGAWKTWTFWQRSEGPDINVYNGTDAEFYARYGSDPRPPVIGDPPMYKGTVIVSELNIRPAAAVSPVTLGKLKAGDKVEASQVIDGWWRIVKITRGITNIPLPALLCFAYQGSANGYIRLDQVIDDATTPPVDSTASVSLEIKVTGANVGSVNVNGTPYIKA